MSHRIIFTAVAFLIIAILAPAAEFPFRDGKQVSIDLPDGWAATHSIGKEGALEIVLTSKDEKRLNCQISVLRAPPPADERLLDPAKLSSTVALLSQFKGIRAKPVSLPTVRGIGFYAYDKGGPGMAMITPEKGVSVTVHFGTAKDFERFKAILSSLSVLDENAEKQAEPTPSQCRLAHPVHVKTVLRGQLSSGMADEERWAGK